MPDRVLADLDDDVVARLESLLDLALSAAESGRLPVHLTGVEHTVAAATDIDEGGFHRGQHILDDAQIDIAHQRRRRRRGHEMLDEDAVLEHRDLGVALALVRRFGARLVAHHHQPFDRFAAGEELRLRQDRRAAPARIAAVAAALALGLQSGGPADALDFIGALGPLLLSPRRTFVHNSVRRIVLGLGL